MGIGRKRRVLNHHKRRKADPETGTGAEIRQFKVVIETGAVVGESGWWLVTIKTTRLKNSVKLQLQEGPLQLGEHHPTYKAADRNSKLLSVLFHALVQAFL